MEAEATIDNGTAESQTTTRGEPAHGADCAMPMTVEEAETVWQALAPVAQRILASLGAMQGCWLVGQHGGELVAIVLRQNGQIESYVFAGNPALLPAVPRFTYSAGRHSLLETIRSKSPARVGESLVWHQTADELAEVLHGFFLYHATKPLPSERPIERYDAARMTLRTGSAESIMEAALHTAVKAAKPSDEGAFRDYWARAALAHVINEGTDPQVLTEAGAKRLDILRACNAHRTRHDLVVQAPLMNLLIQAREEDTRMRAAMEPGLPYHVAQRACLAAFRRAYALALNGKTNHPKTLSQRLIKGLLLASVAKSRLRIGSLVELVTPALAARYGTAWPYMQEIEVVAMGRPSPEWRIRQDVESAAGAFKLLDERGTVLDPPRVLLRAQEVLLYPGAIYHEWLHGRQHMASEVSILDFAPQRLHSEEATECKAIQVEAELLSEFGILY
jgi:hypothetical protein